MFGTKPFISYASNSEDVLLNRIFKNQLNGFYIDIGASHPTFSSTTKSFYERGWFGINVEPSPYYELLKEQRPRDINIKAAITDYNGEITFYINGVSETSSIYPEIDPSIAAITDRSEIITTRAITLNTLIDSNLHPDDQVDFLKIDAEGAEGSIILPTNWSQFRPRIILAESTKPFSNQRIDKEWVTHLENNDYIESYFDGINTWFIRKESIDDLKYFKIPVNLLDNFIKYNPAAETPTEVTTSVEATRLEPHQREDSPTTLKKKSLSKKILKRIKKLFK